LKKIRSIAELESLRADALSRGNGGGVVIRACNTGCRARKSAQLIERIEDEIRDVGAGDTVAVKRTGCHGFCEMGPVLVVEPENIFYCKVKAEDVQEIISETALKGNVLERLLWQDPDTGEQVRRERDLPFYRRQQKVVSGNCGVIDPTDIESYIAAGGYRALFKALLEMTPEDVLSTMEGSGLRGRGGGGFPAGYKWRSCAMTPGAVKYVIANGDEGDPGAFMDRSLMEGDPHAILEGMIICAAAIGASEGYIYVREEYPVAIEHLQAAIGQAEAYGFLGNDILGTGFGFPVKLNRGAGAFICGESTALMRSIEGKRGMPRPKPPNSVYSGLRGRPTVLNNVETFAGVPRIITEGVDWYTSIGTARSKGTKIFSLVGKVKNTGLVEVEMGTTLREIIYGIGGGIKKDKPFKAVQTGGPSGGCIPASKLDMPVDFDSLKEAGAIMGSGGIIVMDETSCMVDIARYFIEFLLFESCGKCIPCREGLRQMHFILNNICLGEGTEKDLDAMTSLANFMTAGSLCGLGSTAAHPVMSTLRHFRSEYESHIFDKKCSAGVCKNLFNYLIDEELCTGCSLCRKRCPEGAISGEKKKPHVLDKSKCMNCGICFSLCKQEAIKVG
jgi:NADH-quinone oxidoreductase subunit F